MSTPFRFTGTHAHRLIVRWFGEATSSSCNCGSMIGKMNAWGPVGCREHRDEIADVMMEEGKKRGWKIAIRGLPTRTITGVVSRVASVVTPATFQSRVRKVCYAIIEHACKLAERDAARRKASLPRRAETDK
jgi:hypothetical protein